MDGAEGGEAGRGRLGAGLPGGAAALVAGQPVTAGGVSLGTGYILFVGTLEPRKNVGGLLQSYTQLVQRWPDAPRLVLAGRSVALSKPWLEALTKEPLASKAIHLGYVADSEREALYKGASVLVLPSFNEGFGLPVLEAMTVGVPVIAVESRRAARGAGRRRHADRSRRSRQPDRRARAHAHRHRPRPPPRRPRPAPHAPLRLD